MNLFLQQVLNGLVLGSIYSLVALGLTLVYGTRGIPNFAHGHLYMLGAYMTLFFVGTYGLHYWPSAILAALVLALAGVVLERLVFHPVSRSSHVNVMIASVGLMLFLEALSIQLWGADYKFVMAPNPAIYRFAGLTISHQQVIVIIAAVILMIGLQLFLKKTMVGSAIEALAQNREGAMLVGINVTRLSMLTFAISAGLASAAASLIAPINLVFPAMGTMVIMKAFAIVVIGGMGSIPGAIAAAYLLALAESLGGTYLLMQYRDLIAFALLAAILAIRPTGLFSRGD